MNTKELTGYPSIDKPWLKWYSEKALSLRVPEMSINDYMELQTKGYDDLIALDFF